MNMGANETPLIPPKTTMRSQEDMDDASSIQDQITEDRASHTDANFTATGSSAIHSTAAQTTGYQSSRIILDTRRDVSNREGLSVIRDVQASKSHSSVRGEGRIKGFPGFSALRDEMMMRRGPAQGLDSAPSNLRRNVNAPEGEVDLYNHDHFTPSNDPFTLGNDPFTPGNDAVEDSASGDTSVPGKVPTAFKRPETGLKGNWAKPVRGPAMIFPPLLNIAKCDYRTLAEFSMPNPPTRVRMRTSTPTIPTRTRTRRSTFKVIMFRPKAVAPTSSASATTSVVTGGLA